MKETETNPWPLIRWAVAALIYAGTIAIAVDQVKSSRADVEKQAKEVLEVKKALTKSQIAFKASQSDMREAQTSAADWKQKTLELAENAGNYLASQEKLNTAKDDRIQHLEAQTVQSSPTAQPIITNPPPAALRTSVAAPAQSVPSSVQQRIHQIYAQKYPDDFSMQKMLIEDQLKCYRFLQQWTTERGVRQDVFSKVRQIYAGKYPDDYSMQKTLIQDQFECYLFIQSYTSALGVPQNVFNESKRKYSDKYPYDFSMQKTLVEDQVKSYLELNR